MIKQECIPLEAPTEWQDTLKGIRHSFGQTWENCYAMHMSSGMKTYLYKFESENARIVCPIVEREYGQYIDIVKPFGFNGFVGNRKCNEFSHAWMEFVRQKGYVCGYLGSDPLFENTIYFNIAEYEQYNSVYVLDLTLSHQELFENLSKNRKRQVRNWQKDILRIGKEVDKEMLINFFLTVFPEFMRRKNATRWYNFSQETLSFLLSSDNVFLVGAGKPDKVEAVSVFAYTPYGGEFLFNASLPEGQHHSVPLLWYAVNFLKELQIPLFNLGGGVSENDSLAQFKARFGAKKVPLRCLKQIFSPKVYAELCTQTGANPNDSSGYFPAYRKP